MDIPNTYHALVAWIIAVTGLDDASLHIHAGLALLLGARLVTKRRLSSMVPLMSVIMAEIVNELLDRMYWGAWRWEDTSVDIFHTLFWPAVISSAAWIKHHRHPARPRRAIRRAGDGHLELPKMAQNEVD